MVSAKLMEDDMVEGEIGTMEEEEVLSVDRFVAATTATFLSKYPGEEAAAG
jgi:hypothetical protein